MLDNARGDPMYGRPARACRPQVHPVMHHRLRERAQPLQLAPPLPSPTPPAITPLTETPQPMMRAKYQTTSPITCTPAWTLAATRVRLPCIVTWRRAMGIQANLKGLIGLTEATGSCERTTGVRSWKGPGVRMKSPRRDMSGRVNADGGACERGHGAYERGRRVYECE